jgi:uncharacterized protein (TIGR04222 family)
MTPERADLLHRILAFEIDTVDNPALPFAARLARENGWSRAHADRVIVEYKRFVFLAMTSAEPVCPSEDVDAAWHLHLTYTKSYWQRFCGEVLGRPLHHEPTKGGPAEADEHRRMYAGTLAAYRVAFDEEPPADVWPPAAVRFGEDLRHRVVNTARNWVIPKAVVKRAAAVVALGAVVGLTSTGCAGAGLNPFNLVGKDFLYFLIPLMIAAVCVGRVIRSHLRSPGPQPGDDDLTLTWERAAYLAGGYPRLTTAAIARLVGCGAARVDEDTNRLVRADHVPTGGLTPVESAVYNALPFANTPDALKPVQELVEARYSHEAARLEGDGLLLGAARQFGVGFAALIPLLLVILFLAVPRLVQGVSSGKPSGYLGVTMIGGGLLGLTVVLAGSLRLTRRGEAVLAGMRDRHAGLKTVGATAGPGAAGLAVALFGTAALAGLGMAALGSWFPRQTDTGSSGGCGSGCGTSSGGDGGGGCGGGGCGGGGGD